MLVGSHTTSLCIELILVSKGFGRQACLSPVVDRDVLKSYEKCSSRSCLSSCRLLAFHTQSKSRWLGKVGAYCKNGPISYIKIQMQSVSSYDLLSQLSSESGLKYYRLSFIEENKNTFFWSCYCVIELSVSYIVMTRKQKDRGRRVRYIG